MTPENITALQALVQADPTLAQQLHTAASTDQAVELLVQAAHKQGIAIEASDIAEHLKSAQASHMSDTDLEAVAGGLLTKAGFNAMSVFTVAIGCYVYSEHNYVLVGDVHSCKVNNGSGSATFARG